ncbi:SRPBCC family protein [Jiangella rhizosphaerae]|uniref:Toxin-antitoxin system toxin subunit n=1 Tax=Jiangella rhizosphaerae TaxID=2293569 RepID=A0A418KNW4_9ACTN|nr:SRPBCC family protein [Jiangella rhizosphaerae]RIQ20766.1 toxin-antitoxin system toxin subunit [Jiangella rhizosphaerae]
MTESLHTDGDRTVLRMERRFRHPRAQVWRALTEPGHLSQWFPARVEFDPVVGADVRFDWGDGAGPTVDGQVTDAEPGRVIGFTWSGERLRFELHDDGDGCRLEFTHVFDDRYGAASFASGWAQCFAALLQVLDGVPVTAASPSAEQHDAYVERFGLDAGVVETVAGGRRVRFERQLTAPAEAAWPVISRLAGVAADDVLERDEPKVLAYTTPGGGRVRWELGEGTGHGARLVVTESAPSSADAAAVAAAWKDRLAELARELRG